MEKKSKGKTIVIVILVLAVLGLGGYIIYDKFVAKEDNKEEKTEVNNKTKEQKENLDEVADILMNNLEKSHAWEFIATKDNPNNIVFDKNMIDDNVLATAIGSVWSTDSSSAKISDLNNLFKVYNIENLNYKDISCFNNDGILYKYDDLAKEYKLNENHPGHGLPTIPVPSYVKKNNIEKQNDEYILTVTTIYSENPVDFEFISADPKGTIKIADFDSYMLEDGSIDTKKLISDYENTFEDKKATYPKYKYTFQKDKDNYYLTKYEEIH